MKKRKESKRYPYVPVEGIDQKYLDACLLSLLDGPALCKSLSDEKALIGKTNLTLTQIIKQNVSKAEIVKEVSPYLHEHYLMYNFLAQVAHGRFGLISEINQGIEFDFDVWKENIEEAIEADQITYFTYINWLRFGNAEYTEIKAAFDKYGYQFEKDTGLVLSDDFQIVAPAEIEDLIEDPIETDFDEILEKLHVLREKVNQENFKAQYDAVLKEKNNLLDLNKALQSEIKTNKDQLKTKEQLLVKKEKEINSLTKDLDSQARKFEQKTKEAGQLGGEVGRLRGEVDELTKQRNQFESEAVRLRKDRDGFQKEIETRLSNQWKSERALLNDTHQREMLRLQRENQALKSQIEQSMPDTSQQDDYEKEISILNRQITLYTQQLKKMDDEYQMEISILKKELAEAKAAPTQLQLKPEKRVDEDDFDLDDLLGDLIDNEPTPI